VKWKTHTQCRGGSPQERSGALQIQHIPPARRLVVLARRMQQGRLKLLTRRLADSFERVKATPQVAQKEIPMNDPRFQTAIHFVIDTTELVRGYEEQFLEQLAPLVCGQSVTLDLRKVTRVDAAGLAALITLYCDACKAGHKFRISNPSHHVAELLALVRLDRLLVTGLEDEHGCTGLELQESAA
jgi:anti-anti-sigma regulatory factor